MRIEHAGMKSLTSQKVRIQKLCIYPSGIEHVGTTLPILRTYPTGIKHAGVVEEVEIETQRPRSTRDKSLTRIGRDGDGRQVQLREV